jgi:predicted GNAT family acetyltransferase
VIEAHDGRFAAYALLWPDDANGVGELEPVGTAPAHRRLGLAGAACLEVARRLRGLGAGTAVVYAVEGSAAGRLYGSLGFEQVDRHVELRRPA